MHNGWNCPWSNATLWVLDTCLTVRLLPFSDHFDHSFIVFKNVQLSFELRGFCACDNVIHSRQFINFSVTVSFRCGVGVGASDSHLVLDFSALDHRPFSYRQWSLTAWWVFFEECNTSITTSHRSRAGIPSIRKLASKEITSDSLELWDTCFLHTKLMETNVRLRKTHEIPPEVDLEPSRSPAKSDSWNKHNRQCWALIPTGQYCR